MLTGVITDASGVSITLVEFEPATKADLEQHHIGFMLREQTKRGGGLDFENGDGIAGVDALALLQRRAQFVIADECATAGVADPETFVEPHQKRRGQRVDAKAGSFQDRAQIRDGRTLAIGAGDMDHRRQFAFGMAEPLQQPVHAVEAEVDPARMQRGQPRDQVAQWLMQWSRRHVHACGAGALSAADTICAALTTVVAFGAVSTAGDLVRSRHSRASVGRMSWRCTTMSTMPWSLRYSAR